MLPRFGEIKDEQIVKLMCLKQETPDIEKTFMNNLQDGIEFLITAKEIKALNKKWNLAARSNHSGKVVRKNCKDMLD